MGDPNFPYFTPSVPKPAAYQWSHWVVPEPPTKPKSFPDVSSETYEIELPDLIEMVERVETALTRFLEDRSNDNFCTLLNETALYDDLFEMIQIRIDSAKRLRTLSARIIEERLGTDG